MEQETTILEGYSAAEKAAYLGAIASLATADRTAGEEEISYLEALCESAGLSDTETESVRQAASSEMTDTELKSYLDVLKTSELRFSLVSDVIAFAQADQNYSDEEKQNVKNIADYLGVNQDQFSVLNQFTNKAVEEAPGQADALQTGQTSPQGFLDKLGFGDKLKSAGINTNSLVKGALGILGPIILAKMFSGGRRRSGGLGAGLGGALSGGGGGLLGSLLGGGGGLLGGLLGGGRGFGNAGGMLGRILGKRGL
jgi:uncharacterized tellurite resistance protein B-like protein